MGYIEQLKLRIQKSETTARSVVESSLQSAEELNRTLNAFLDLNNQAPKQAEMVKQRGALAGIPIAIQCCLIGHETYVFIVA